MPYFSLSEPNISPEGEISDSHGDEYENDCLNYVVPCGLVEIYRRFKGAVKMEEVSRSETSVNLYQTAWRNIP
jgi:hypothetical protein